MSDKDMEKEIVDKGLTYPRITNDEIEAKMKDVQYDCHIVPGTTTTVITAYLVIGYVNFTLATEIMACVDPRNFNKELGEKYGKEKAAKAAKDKLWELEGYRLAHEISSKPADFVGRLNEEYEELKVKVDKLDDFLVSDGLAALDGEQQALLSAQSVYMKSYVEVLRQRIEALGCGT